MYSLRCSDEKVKAALEYKIAKKNDSDSSDITIDELSFVQLSAYGSVAVA